MIEPGHDRLSVVRQCALVSLGRSTFYRAPAAETAENLALMRLLDAQFLETPWYGSRQMVRQLRRQGRTVEPRQHLTASDACVVVDLDGRDAPGDLGAHLHRRHGFDVAGRANLSYKVALGDGLHAKACRKGQGTRPQCEPQNASRDGDESRRRPPDKPPVLPPLALALDQLRERTAWRAGGHRYRSCGHRPRPQHVPCPVGVR